MVEGLGTGCRSLVMGGVVVIGRIRKGSTATFL